MYFKSITLFNSNNCRCLTSLLVKNSVIKHFLSTTTSTTTIKANSILNRNKNLIFHHQKATIMSSKNTDSLCHVIELRSDTFTKPSEKMLKAMVSSDIGDSSYDEDPTTIQLERKIAELLGKEASIFVPSGTMSNLIAVLTHCDRRDHEVILGDKSHIHIWEQGAISGLGGVYSKQIETLPDGSYDLDKLESILSLDLTDRWCVKTQLICFENTHNLNGGRVIKPDYLDKLQKLCQKHNLKLHLDGSRIMNAAVALNIDVKELVRQFDSVNFCFSKGLGAPFGSVLVGSKEFIDRAIRVRQSLGGGLRQSGVLAAACLVGLEDMFDNLKRDNENAKRLVSGINEIKSNVWSVDVEHTESNIVILNIDKSNSVQAPTIVDRLKTVKPEEKSALNESICVKSSALNSKVIRMVTHCDVSTQQIDLAVKKIRYVLDEMSN